MFTYPETVIFERLQISSLRGVMNIINYKCDPEIFAN